MTDALTSTLLLSTITTDIEQLSPPDWQSPAPFSIWIEYAPADDGLASVPFGDRPSMVKVTNAPAALGVNKAPQGMTRKMRFVVSSATPTSRFRPA